MPLQIGHITDIHLKQWSELHIRDFLGKRLTGYLNYQLRRRFEYDETVLVTALKNLAQQPIDALVISGDVSNLGFDSEFQYTRRFIDTYIPQNIPKLVVPGNHDRYVTTTQPEQFEKTFEGWTGQPCVPGHTWPRYKIIGNLRFILLDSGVPTPWFRAWGALGKQQLQALEQYLDKDPENPLHTVVIVHHHPSIALYKNHDDHRNLRDAHKLRSVIAEHPIDLVLHGHNHYFDVRRMREAEDTVLFGLSSSITSNAGEYETDGQYALHQLDESGCLSSTVANWNGQDFNPCQTINPQDIRSESPEEVPQP